MLRLIPAIMLALGLLSACGQSGDLYLPEQSSSPSENPES